MVVVLFLAVSVFQHRGGLLYSLVVVGVNFLGVCSGFVRGLFGVCSGFVRGSLSVPSRQSHRSPGSSAAPQEGQMR